MPDKINHHLLCPSGRFAERVVTFSITSANIDRIYGDGRIDDWSHGDFPEMQLYEMDAGHKIVMDGEGVEWLDSHCRVVSGNFEADEYEEQIISPWPESIQADCLRVKCLHDVVRQISILNTVAPEGFHDTTTKVVLDEVVRKRCDAEIGAIEARIDEYRKGDPRVVMPDEERGDAEA